MIHKLFGLLICLLSAGIFGQANTAITNSATGSLLPESVSYCPGDSFSLTTNTTASSTGDYKVGVYNFSLVTSGNNVSFPNTTGNNHFSSVISLPFTFEIYGKSYTKVVVGSNGRLILGNGTELDSFYTLSDGTPSVQIPNSVYQNINGTSYNLAEIFFGYNAKNYQPSDYTKITQTQTTINGRPAFGISISGVNPTGNYSRKSYSSVYLVSGTNEIVIQYYETDGNGLFQTGTINSESVLGLQNETGNKAKWPSLGTDINSNDPNSPYNYGKWANTQQAYIFTPNQNLTPQYNWKVDGVSKSASKDFSYTPLNSQENLSLEVTFLEDPNLKKTSSVTFKYYEKPTITVTPGTTCGQATTLSVNNPVTGITYTWYSDDPAFLQTGTTISAAKTGNYYAVPNGCIAQKSNSANVVISSQLPPLAFVSGKVFPDCDNLGQTSKSFNLSTVAGYLPGADYTLEFTDMAGNVVANAANAYTVSVNSGETRSFKIIVNSLKDPSCKITTANDFSVSYLSFPVNATVTSGKLCVDDTSYTISDFKTDFPNYSGFDVDFSTDGTSFTQNAVNPSAYPSVYARLSKSGFSCSTDIKLNFDFYPAVSANAPTTQLPPQCGNDTETFNLASLIPEINNSPDVNVTFHESLANAQDGTNPVALNYRSGMGTNVLYARVTSVTGCVTQNFPTVTLLVYPKPKRLKDKITLTNCADDPVFNLTQNISELTDAQAPVTPVLEYYDGNGQQIFGSDITAYNASLHGLNPTVKIAYNPTCSDVVLFNLVYYPKPAPLTSQTLYCEETEFTLDQFKKLVANNPAQYTFYEEDKITALRSIFNLNSPLSVNYYLKDNTSGCWSDLLTFNFVKGSPTPLRTSDSSFADCDQTGDLFDGKTVFDLTARKADFTADANAQIKFYKDAAHTQEITSPASYTNETPFAQAVYLKIQSAGYCPTEAILNLIVNTPTKSSTLQPKYLICDGEKIQVDAGPENTSFKWSDGQTDQIATFTKPGNYSVILTNSKGCSYTQEFIVSDENQPKITNVLQTNEKIEVTVSGGNAPYTYYFNGVESLTGNVLLNPTAPEYEIYAVSADGCKGPSVKIYSIVVKNVITPNGDGFNDTWNIPNLDKMQNVEMMISDRYGKTVFYSTDGAKAWDGTAAGRVLPTATYWYVVKWYDPVTKKNEVRQGWILLKNRN